MEASILFKILHFTVSVCFMFLFFLINFPVSNRVQDKSNLSFIKAVLKVNLWSNSCIR